MQTSLTYDYEQPEYTTRFRSTTMHSCDACGKNHPMNKACKRSKGKHPASTFNGRVKRRKARS